MTIKQRLVACLWLVYLFSLPPVQAGQVQLIDSQLLEPGLFVQGLEFSPNGDLTLGTGLYGESRIGILEAGRFRVQDQLADHLFGEGISYSPQGLWQLTWKAGKLFQRDPVTFEVLAEYSYPGEGWGLAYDWDQDVFWMSDGSNILYQRHSEDFTLLDEVAVSYQGEDQFFLNELEWVDGYIYANQWYQNYILQIDLESGDVVARYDLGPLIQDQLNELELAQIDSLNGIAHIEGDRFVVTGKLYPYLFEVRLIRKEDP